jgi:hypothetical protein
MQKIMEFQDIKTKELIVKEKALLLQPVKEKKTQPRCI